MRVLPVISTFAFAAALAACGGDSDAPPAPPQEPITLEALPLRVSNAWSVVGVGERTMYGGYPKYSSTFKVSVPDIHTLPAGTRFARAEVVASSREGVAVKNPQGDAVASLDLNSRDADEDGNVALALENAAMRAGVDVLKITTDAADFDIGNGISQESGVLLAELRAGVGGNTCALTGRCAVSVNAAVLPTVITIPAGGTLKIEQRVEPSAQQPGVQYLCNPGEQENCFYGVQSTANMTLEYADGALLLNVPANTRPGDYPAALTLGAIEEWEAGSYTLALTLTPTIRVTR